MRRREEDGFSDLLGGRRVENAGRNRFSGQVRAENQSAHAVRNYIHLRRRQAAEKGGQLGAELLDRAFRTLRAILEEVNVRHIVGSGLQICQEVSEGAGGILRNGAGSVEAQLDSVQQHHRRRG